MSKTLKHTQKKKKFHHKFYYPHVPIEVIPAERFVFFNSLSDDYPELAWAAERTLAQGAESELGYNMEKDQYSITENIQSMIQTFEKIVEAERENELDYINTKIINNPVFSKYTTIAKELFNASAGIKKGTNDAPFDYIKMITLINNILLGSNFLKKNLETEKRRIIQVQKSFNSITKKKKITRTHKVKENYIFKRKLYTSLMSQGDKIEDSVMEVLRKRTEIIVNKICNEPAIYAQISQAVASQGKLFNPQNFMAIVIPIIIDEVFSSLQGANGINIFSKSEDQILDTLIKHLNNPSNINEFSNISGLQGMVSSANKASIAMRLFEKDSSAKGTYQMLQDPESEIQSTFEYLMNSDFSQTNNVALLKKVTQIRNKITEALERIEALQTLKETEGDDSNTHFIKRGGKLYRKDFKLNEEIEIKNPKDYLTRMKQELTKRVHNLAVKIKELEEKSSMEWIESQLMRSSLKMNTPDFAELLTGIVPLLNDKSSYGSLTGKANLKNDAGEIIIKIPKFKDKPDLEPKYQKELEQVMSSFEKDLNQAVFEERTGEGVHRTATNTQVDLKALRNHTAKTIETLEDMDDELDKLSAAALFLKNTLRVNKSIKQYHYYDNDIGAVGGSLGKNYNAIAGIENIYSMFEAGGITPADKDWLIFAILNSSPSSYGFSLREPIGKHLAFIASLMMFQYTQEEVEQASKNYVEEISSSTPEMLNLYVVQGFHFPSSFVLTLILDGLKKTYNLIETTQYKSSGGQIVIKNNATYNNIMKGEKTTSKKDWIKVSNDVQNHTQIAFTFLAGLLDIMDQIEAYVNQPFPQ